MDRINLLLGSIDPAVPIIEMGPGHNPIAPKARGWATHIVDCNTADELRNKFAVGGVTVDAVEEVDTVWHDGSLHDAVPARLHGSFRRLIASHVLEHIPDPVALLNSAARLLSPDGIVAFAIPDRRYCFDVFKPASGTGDLLEAFVSRRTRHSVRTTWTQIAYSATMDGSIAWGQYPITSVGLIGDFNAAERAFKGFQDGFWAPYSDCHAWHFTPAGFALAILELGQLKLIDWRIETISAAEGCEFIAILRRGRDVYADPGELQARRLSLLLQQLEEQREQIDFALAGGLLATKPSPPASLQSIETDLEPENSIPPAPAIVEFA